MPNLKLCMISGSFEYDAQQSLQLFAEHIDGRFPIDTNVIVYANEDDDRDLSPIDDCDVLLVFTRRLNTAGAQLDRFIAYCDAGRPIVGVRTASHAFQNWLVFDRQVLGGNYQGHYGAGSVCRVERAADHPILEGVSAFDSHGSLYKNTPLAPGTVLLLNGSTPEHVEPVAWTRFHNGGRVFYTSLGHQKDFSDAPDFLRLLANGVLWAGGRI